MGKKWTESETTSKGSETQTQNGQYQNSFDWKQAPDNPYFKQAEGLISGYDGGASAAREAASRNVNEINNSGNEFLGAYTPDYVRDKVRQSRLFSNNLQLGSSLAGANQNALQAKTAGYMSLGEATQPRLVQTGGTQSSTGTSNSESSGTGYQPFLGAVSQSAGSALGQ